VSVGKREDEKAKFIYLDEFNRTLMFLALYRFLVLRFSTFLL